MSNRAGTVCVKVCKCERGCVCVCEGVQVGKVSPICLTDMTDLLFKLT